MNSPTTLDNVGDGSAVTNAPTDGARWRCLDAQPKSIPIGWDRLQGLFQLAAGKAREQWGRLRHDEHAIDLARRQQFTARIQRRYGVAMAEAERLRVACERSAGDPWYAARNHYR